MDAVTTAQVATAVGTVVLAISTVVLAFATIILARVTARQAEVSREVVQENRELVRANREMVEEMRQTRIAQDRPHVLVDVDFTYAPVLDIVIRNIGRGPAKNVRFDPLPDLITSRDKNISDFAYFRNGLDFLAPGVEVRTFWDMAHKLMPLLDQRGDAEGFAITAHYESATGEAYSSSWTLNPLLFRERQYIRRYGIHDLADAVKDIRKDFHRVAGLGTGELRVSTKSERLQEAARFKAELEAEHQEDVEQGEEDADQV